MHKILSGLAEGWWMFFDTFWALILGFALSGLIQALISRERMQQILGDHRPRAIGKASFYGMVSSSCSYAASALARSIFIKGGDFTASMVFMFASTNLVVELGLVLWMLIGWQFAAAEFIGGAIMILLLAALLPRILKESDINGAFETAGSHTLVPGEESLALHGLTPNGASALTPNGASALTPNGGAAPAPEATSAYISDDSPLKKSITFMTVLDVSASSMKESGGADVNAQAESENSTKTKWRVIRGKLSNASGFTIGDFTMLRVELVVGFIVAGLATTVISFSFWRSLFISGHGLVAIVENAIIGPILAFISFVCSVGNVPLAAALWSAGITFGGVISFIFADLLAFPLVMIYRKYYGNRFTVKLVLVFWLTISISGMLTEGIFAIFGVIPEHSQLAQMSGSHFGLNGTTALDSIAFILLAGIVYLYRTREVDSSHDFAMDPICGMQVRKADAPATASVDGIDYYFCMEGCKESFLKQNERAS